MIMITLMMNIIIAIITIFFPDVQYCWKSLICKVSCNFLTMFDCLFVVCDNGQFLYLKFVSSRKHLTVNQDRYDNADG